MLIPINQRKRRVLVSAIAPIRIPIRDIVTPIVISSKEKVAEVRVSIKEFYYIKKIENKVANEVVKEYHYLERKAPTIQSYGLFEIKTNKMVGVIIYGKPASSSLCEGICGKEYSKDVVELTRLWIEDTTPGNAESFLIGNTIKLLEQDIVVSFAEMGVGHTGMIYQATNFIYTGLSAKRRDLVFKDADMNNNKHGRHLLDQYGGWVKAKEAIGDKLMYIDRPRKHRYIYFNCKGKRRIELLSKLRYSIEKYPKNPSKEDTTKTGKCFIEDHIANNI